MEATVTTTRTTSKTQTAVDVENLRSSLRRAALETRLEQFLRMRLGVNEPEDTPIEYRGQNDEQTRVKLAMMEREFLDELRGALTPPEVAQNKERILRKLRDLGDKL
jgi:hypothetical protein